MEPLGLLQKETCKCKTASFYFLFQFMYSAKSQGLGKLSYLTSSQLFWFPSKPLDVAPFGHCPVVHPVVHCVHRAGPGILRAFLNHSSGIYSFKRKDNLLRVAFCIKWVYHKKKGDTFIRKWWISTPKVRLQVPKFSVFCKQDVGQSTVFATKHI